MKTENAKLKEGLGISFKIITGYQFYKKKLLVLTFK